MIEQEAITRKRTAWTRQQGKVLQLVQDLENELESLRKKGVHPDFIEKKSKQLDLIIDTVNYADELIQLLIFDHNSGALEILFLERSLSQQVTASTESVSLFGSREHTLDLVKAMVQSYKDSSNAAQ
jgi:hypothetical protein